MAEGNIYEDESELQPSSQQKQVNKSVERRQQLNLSEPYNWKESDLNVFVQEGTLRKDESTLEHLALHPYWLSNPLNGVKEELESSLGKWRPSMNGYLVAVKNVRLERRKASRYPKVGFMYQDQPWIHVDAGATFYLYTPIIGQKVTGTIMKIGAKAVICVLFKCFSVSVFPEHDDELYTWSMGDELAFEITAVQNRRRGPIIRAKSLGVPVTNVQIAKTVIDPTLEDWTIEASGGQDEDWTIEASGGQDDDWNISPVKQKQHVHFEVDKPSEEPKTKKKKKKHRNKEYNEANNYVQELEHYPVNIFDEQDEPVKPSKKRKHKEKQLASLEEDLPLPEISTPASHYQELNSKKKHKRRSSISEVVASNVIENSDDSIVPKKKKKKHKEKDV